MNNAEFDAVYFTKSPYKFWVDDHVRFNDLDALGHVGSVRTNEFFASARTGFFRQSIPHWPISRQIPILKVSVVQHEREISFPANLQTGLFLERFGGTSITLAMGLFSGETCLTLCRSIFIFIDDVTRQPITPTREIKEAFLSIAREKDDF